MIKDESMNIEYNLDYTTSQKSVWVNKCTHIMLHHTWGGNFSWNMTYLSRPKETYASAHYVVWLNGEIGRIGLDTFILWHAWKWRHKDMQTNFGNSYCIGIEVVSEWKVFTVPQVRALAKLVRELQKKHNIPTEKVIRHEDYAWYRGKWDIWENFYKVVWCTSYSQWLREEIDRVQTKPEPLPWVSIKQATQAFTPKWDYRKLAWKSPFSNPVAASNILESDKNWDEKLSIIEIMARVVAEDVLKKSKEVGK